VIETKMPAQHATNRTALRVLCLDSGSVNRTILVGFSCQVYMNVTTLCGLDRVQGYGTGYIVGSFLRVMLVTKISRTNAVSESSGGVRGYPPVD
jgi:hypothetical protein